MARRLSHIGGRRKAEGQLLKARRCTGGGSKEVFSFVSSRRPQILEKEKALGAKATEASCLGFNNSVVSSERSLSDRLKDSRTAYWQIKRSA